MASDPQRPGKSRALRAGLAGPRLIRAVGAHNGLTARLAERAGFEAVWASSFELAASHALPDASLLTMSHYLDAAEVMDAATTLPVIADCDTGFGGPLNVAHAVRSFERRGVAAICIEDKVFPKMNSFAATPQKLLPTEEFALKIEAGRAARTDPDFVLVARTEAMVVGEGVDEALRRCRTYHAAGADAILVHSKSRRPQEVLDFAQRWDCDVPLVAVPTTYDSVHETELLAAGYRVVIYANHGLRAAIAGTTSALATLAAEGRADALAGRIAPMGEVFELQGMTLAYEASA